MCTYMNETEPKEGYSIVAKIPALNFDEDFVFNLVSAFPSLTKLAIASIVHLNANSLTNQLNGVQIKLYFQSVHKLGWLQRTLQLQLLLVSETAPLLAKLFSADCQRSVGGINTAH